MSGSRPSRGEHAFTVVEVIIAALLATAILSGLALAVASGGKLIGKSEVNLQMARASSSVFERLESNDGWVSNCGVPAGQTSANCTLYTNPGGVSGTQGSGPIDLNEVADDDKLDATWKLSVTGVAVDDPADGLRSDPRGDRDGRVPDRITVRVVLDAPDVVKERLGNPRTFEQSRTFDGRGKMASGSLIVEVCDVKNQIDDRMNIETCGTRASASRMADCPPGKCSVFPRVANNPASVSSPNGSVLIQRWISPIPIAITSGSERVVGTSLGDGSYVFKDVAAGSWTVQYPDALANGHVVWAGHVRPAAGQVAVQPNTTSRALISYRPVRQGKVDVRFTRRVGFIRWSEAERTQTDFAGDYVWRKAQWGCGYDGTTCPNELFRYQSYYREHNKATIYVVEPHLDWQIWGGASDEVTLSARPEAFGRSINMSANPPLENISVTKVLPRRGYNSDHIEELRGLQPGLSSSLDVNTEANMRVLNDARRVTSGGIWVNADTGAVNGGNASFELRGQGECYVAFDGVNFPEGETTYDSHMDDKQMIMAGRNQKYVDVPGFGGWRDDSCSMSKLRWKGVDYDCKVVCAFRGCWWKWTQYKNVSSERATVDDPWTPDEWTTGEWNEHTDCKGYDPPLACTDWGATNCGPAPVIIYIPPVEIGCQGCGSTPPTQTRFHGVDFGA